MTTTIKVRWSVFELTNVMSLYNTQKVYRSTTSDPFDWIEITGVPTRVPLVANTYDYLYDDETGDAAYYYCTAFYHTGTTAESEKSDAMRAQLDAAYLTLNDLYNLIGPARVKGFFDDDIDETIADANNPVNAILTAAEAEASSRMLRSYGSVDNIKDLADNDQTFKNHVAWVALEFASERRPEFAGNEGQGQFMTQYNRAITFFENLSKGRQRSKGETVAGVGANTGGILQPARSSANQPRFIFASDKAAPGGHGSF